MVGPLAPLARCAGELRAPRVREHPRFGTLTFDRRLDSWNATPTWCGARVRLRLYGADDAMFDASLRAADELFADQPTWSRRIKDFAVAVAKDIGGVPTRDA